MSGSNKRPYKALRVPVCPCGGHVIVRNVMNFKRKSHFDYAWQSVRYQAVCTKCLDGATASTRKAAIDKFNRLHEIKLTT